MCSRTCGIPQSSETGVVIPIAQLGDSGFDDLAGPLGRDAVQVGHILQSVTVAAVAKVELGGHEIALPLREPLHGDQVELSILAINSLAHLTASSTVGNTGKSSFSASYLSLQFSPTETVGGHDCFCLYAKRRTQMVRSFA